MVIHLTCSHLIGVWSGARIHGKANSLKNIVFRRCFFIYPWKNIGFCGFLVFLLGGAIFGQFCHLPLEKVGFLWFLAIFRLIAGDVYGLVVFGVGGLGWLHLAMRW